MFSDRLCADIDNVCVSMCAYVYFCPSKKVPPAHPFVKRVPGLVLGSKVHWLCLTNGTGGTSGAHTCSGRYSQYSCELLARAPAEIASHRHIVPA